ncbi:Similar to hypothetical protein TRIVIDRAFT_191998 [Trichoderma virens Gv29-8]; acc. no. EHK21704 [Pyronema omphalodes CBS 100304]|uniref:Uncharacterized protein n=1 Tax=Pyronema omphalodes (strain CBS 100304) TaxID=1076935 RepID=U4LML8_PYROM|nr:Similar to hypothetical protein TRIVIDRAFT_191998 [Trichoderma virens Gv29-8]; acc. no. EHK21704 [Pyronema omphalodes CBS 100304]
MAKIRRDTWLYLALASILAGILIFSSVIVARGHNNSTHTAIDADFATLNMTVGRIRFESEPKGRGTVGILLSCTLTFVFCIWTVVHPNVLPDSTLWTRSLYKAVLMVIAVINPEGVVISAYGQWQDARLLNQAIDNYFEKLIKSPDNSVKTAKEMEKKRLEWLGMDGAFFVVMGGFLIDVSNCESAENVGTPTMKKCGTVKPRKPSRFTATLTPPGFIKYLHEGYFDNFERPPFNRAQIADKGKASNIAKVLSASQAVWLLVQSAARWAMGMKLRQVACTALIFYFWWYKPLDVNEPIRLKLVKKDGSKTFKVTPIKDIERGRSKDDAASVLVSMERVNIGNEPPPKPTDVEDARLNTTSTASSNTLLGTPTTPPATASSRASTTALITAPMTTPTTAPTTESTTASTAEPTTTSTAVSNATSTATKNTTSTASPPLILPFADIPDWEFVHPLRRPFTITRSQSHTGMKARALHDIVFYITGGTVTEDMTKAPEGLKSRALKKKTYDDELGSESESEDDNPGSREKELGIYVTSAVIPAPQSQNSASEPGVQTPITESQGQEISNTVEGSESQVPVMESHERESLNPVGDSGSQITATATENEGLQNTVGNSGSDGTIPTTPGDESAHLIPQVPDEKQKRPKLKRSGGNRRMFVEGVFISVIAFLHGLAWNVYFPTDVERLAWRLSCIGMFGFPLPAIMIASFASYHDDLAKLLWYLACAQYKHWQWALHAVLCIYDMANVHRKKATIPGTRHLTLCGHIFLIIICLLLLLGYLICILTITYESYVSIRDPPKTTFETPRWSDYWPHI